MGMCGVGHGRGTSCSRGARGPAQPVSGDVHTVHRSLCADGTVATSRDSVGVMPPYWRPYASLHSLYWSLKTVHISRFDEFD